jgi:hypothetical protein
VNWQIGEVFPPYLIGVSETVLVKWNVNRETLPMREEFPGEFDKWTGHWVVLD